jgi:hypothetical protein
MATKSLWLQKKTEGQTGQVPFRKQNVTTTTKIGNHSIIPMTAHIPNPLYPCKNNLQIHSPFLDHLG